MNITIENKKQKSNRTYEQIGHLQALYQRFQR